MAGVRWRACDGVRAMARVRYNPLWGRGTSCAFAVNNISADPPMRLQAMAEDRIGWAGAKIANPLSRARASHLGAQTQAQRRAQSQTLRTRLRTATWRGLRSNFLCDDSSDFPPCARRYFRHFGWPAHAWVGFRSGASPR
eukprot:6176306-Pleurochrysis_carterae.AAC.2